MKKFKRNFYKYGTLGAAVALVGVTATSCSNTYYDFFAQIIVSNNTSVINDASFSESAYYGWANYMEENGISMPDIASIPQSTGIWRRPGNTNTDFVSAYKGAFAEGTDMLITPGFNHQTPISSVVSDPTFANNGFLLLDSEVAAPNVCSFQFRAEQSGFLTGISVCMFLNENLSFFTSQPSRYETGTLKVGGFVGQAYYSTMDFLSGFQHGIFAFNNRLRELRNDSTNSNALTEAWGSEATNFQEVEWINLDSSIGTYVTGSFAEGDGETITQTLLNAGADAILPVAGSQTTDAVTVAESYASRTEAKYAVVCGVDSAQEDQDINQPIPGSPTINTLTFDSSGNVVSGTTNEAEIIQMSAIKDLTTAVYQVLRSVFNTDDPNNANDTLGTGIKGFGYSNVGTIDTNTTGVSQAGLPYVSKFNSSWVTYNTTTGTATVNSSVIQQDPFYQILENGRYLYNLASWPYTSTTEYYSSGTSITLPDYENNTTYHKVTINTDNKAFTALSSTEAADTQTYETSYWTADSVRLNAVELGWTLQH